MVNLVERSNAVSRKSNKSTLKESIIKDGQKVVLNISDSSKDLGGSNYSKLYDLTYNGIEMYPKSDDVPFAWDATCEISGGNFIITGDLGQQGNHSGEIKITLPLSEVSKYYELSVYPSDPDAIEELEELEEILVSHGWL